MANNNTLVSVIIPSYNRAHLLPRAIESVLNQTYTNTQIILVDDGSTDDTAALVKSYKKVEYVLQLHSGQGRARNTGLKVARGVYIASLDSDDAWEPDFLKRCVAVIEQNKQFGFVFANWMQVVNKTHGFDFLMGGNVHLKKYVENSPDSWASISNDELRYLYTKGCPSPSSALLIRRASMVTKWQEGLNIADDWCLLLDMILIKNCSAAFIPDRLWIKTTDGSNIFDGAGYLKVTERLYIHDFAAIIKRYKAYLTKAELNVIETKHVQGMCRLSLNRLFALKEMSKYFKLLVLAFRTNPYLSADVMFTMARRKIRKWTSKNYVEKGKHQVELIRLPTVQAHAAVVNA